MTDTIILIGSITGAVLTVGGVAVAVIKWVLTQNRKAKEIEELRARHAKDMEEARRKETEDIQAIKDELCVLSYAMLASLDGLMQQGCNGNVTKAHDSLEKHLNRQAHSCAGPCGQDFKMP